MNSEEKNAIRKQIETDISTLSHQITGLQEKLAPIGKECCLDEVAREELLVEHEINGTILEKSEQHLNALRNALLRIDTPLFGICVECEEPIGFERMRLRPESVRCVECAN